MTHLYVCHDTNIQMLFIGNHQTLSLDLTMLVSQVYDEKGVSFCCNSLLIQPNADRLAQNPEIPSETLPAHQNSAHGIYN